MTSCGILPKRVWVLISIDEIIEMNVEKLEARYPGGEFDVHYSENRKEGDL